MSRRTIELHCHRYGLSDIEVAIITVDSIFGTGRFRDDAHGCDFVVQDELLPGASIGLSLEPIEAGTLGGSITVTCNGNKHPVAVTCEHVIRSDGNSAKDQIAVSPSNFDFTAKLSCTTENLKMAKKDHDSFVKKHETALLDERGKTRLERFRSRLSLLSTECDKLRKFDRNVGPTWYSSGFSADSLDWALIGLPSRRKFINLVGFLSFLYTRYPFCEEAVSSL